MSNSIQTKTVTFKVFRFNSDVDYIPRYDTYTFDVTSEQVVLDILNKIKWEEDGSFSYRRSCRHGICGACAMKVNGRATLACKERMFDMIDLYGNEMTLEPSSIKRAVKDLIIDKGDFWAKNDQIKPYLIADIDENPTQEKLVPPEKAEDILEADLCIQCGACHYSCPVVEISDDFIGPAAFVKAYRFEADVRDSKHNERFHEISKPSQGVWDCVKCMECAEACPKEINPIEKITKLHNMLFQEGIVGDNPVAERHAIGFAHSIKKHGLLDEGELVRYSEGNIGVLKHVPVAIEMFKKGKIVMPWNMPKSEKLDEIQKLVKSSHNPKY